MKNTFEFTAKYPFKEVARRTSLWEAAQYLEGQLHETNNFYNAVALIPIKSKPLSDFMTAMKSEYIPDNKLRLIHIETDALDLRMLNWQVTSNELYKHADTLILFSTNKELKSQNLGFYNLNQQGFLHGKGQISLDWDGSQLVH